MIKGIPVRLAVKTPDGVNEFGEELFSTEFITVDDVLVGEPSSEDSPEVTHLDGSHVSYTLAIPKGDCHKWEDTEVVLPSPFCGKYRTVGEPTAGIEANIPLRWNRKVRIERFE